MKDMFIEKLYCGKRILQYQPWIEEGLVHGFTGVDYNFCQAELPSACQSLCGGIEARALLLPAQTHSKKCIVIEDNQISKALTDAPERSFLKLEEGDAVISRFSSGKRSGVVFGVRTADCLPLLIRSDGWLAAVHAGWRGMAIGVIQEACETLHRLSKTRRLEVLMGPAAGPDSYEVGPEVVAALKPYAVCKGKGGEPPKAMLSLADTAAAIIKEFSKEEAAIFHSRVCTITDKNYYSHRRSAGVGGARNLSFFVV